MFINSEGEKEKVGKLNCPYDLIFLSQIFILNEAQINWIKQNDKEKKKKFNTQN